MPDHRSKPSCMAAPSSSASQANNGHQNQSTNCRGRAATATSSHQRAAAHNSAAENRVATDTSESRFSAPQSGNAVRCKMPATTSTAMAAPQTAATTLGDTRAAAPTARATRGMSLVAPPESLTRTTPRPASSSDFIPTIPWTSGPPRRAAPPDSPTSDGTGSRVRPHHHAPRTPDVDAGVCTSTATGIPRRRPGSGLHQCRCGAAFGT